MRITVNAAAMVAAYMLGSMAVAQTAPMASAATAVPAADMKKIDQCKAMKHDAMMKSPMCMKMMKIYPDAFAGSATTN